MKLKIYSLGLLKHIFLWGVSLQATSLCKATELIYGIENEIKNYNISRSLDKNAFALSELTTEALFYQKADGSIAPDLVTDYKRTGKIWTLKLRKSRFSNGKELSCLDVKANIDEGLSTNRAASIARLRGIVRTECKDNTLTIETNEEAPHLMRRMGHIIRIYDVATIQNKDAAGSGPFYVAKKEGKDLILLPNPYSERKTSFSAIRFRTLRDPWLRDLALMSGNVDFLLENFSLQRLKAYDSRDKGELKVYRNPGLLLFYLVLKPEKFTLAQRAYLRNVLYREKVAQEFWGTQVQAEQKIFDDRSLPSPEALERPAQFPPIEVSVVADETQINFIKKIAEALEKYKIKIRLRPLEFASYMKRLNSKNFDAYFFYVDTSHAMNLEALLHSRGNRLDIKDTELDGLFQSFAQSDDPQKDRGLEEKIDERVATQAYLLPLYRPYKQLVASSRLKLTQTDEGFWRDLLRASK